MKALVAIEKKLRSGCRIKVESAESYAPGQWTACIFTERNDWPHWIQFSAPTPAGALSLLSGFLNGTVPDHANNKRPPSAFLKNGKVTP